jgi:hypothetical protein
VFDYHLVLYGGPVVFARQVGVYKLKQFIRGELAGVIFKLFQEPVAHKRRQA